MTNKYPTSQRRLQIVILGYGLLMLSPQLKESGPLMLLAALALCLGYLLLSLHSAVPGLARPSRKEPQHRPLLFTRMRLGTPLPQV